MRYFPTILAAGLLSAGLLAGSGPAHAIPTLALDRSAVADTQVKKVAYYHRSPGDIIAVATAVAITATAMATTDPTMVMATDDPIMVMDMGVAGVTEMPHSIAG